MKHKQLRCWDEKEEEEEEEDEKGSRLISAARTRTAKRKRGEG